MTGTDISNVGSERGRCEYQGLAVGEVGCASSSTRGSLDGKRCIRSAHGTNLSCACASVLCMRTQLRTRMRHAPEETK